ncbi:MAG TPA: PKD domain-containing protein [Bacteroidia bacterium]|nr:PKD domain-containing protein [Bacteroidia bacterium]
MRKLLLTVLFFVTSAVILRADHVVGSDIVYKCLGNGKYEIIFKFYRDCNGCNVAGGGGGGTGASCPHPVLDIKGDNGSCNGQSLGTVSITRQSITDITQLCGSTKSKCENGSFPYGIEEHLYTGIVDFSARIAQGCCKFKISTTIYVRSTTISTGAANAGFYTDATIDACNGICNSSPSYTSHPVAIICVGQDFVFNNGALDTIDVGDSLSYALAPAYQGAGSQVGYTGSFSPTTPMSFLGFPNVSLNHPAGFRLDPVTGDLSFRPTKLNETGVIVIEVTEWRRINGVMTVVGVTRRDMQVIVVNCPDNKIPIIYPPFTANACAGQQVCMDIRTYDNDSTRDTVKISWNRGIPKATFTHNNGTVRFASGTVCWTPGEADVSNIPHTFTITARDNACPLNGSAIRAFSIYVKESPKATRVLTKLSCGMVTVSATPAKTYPGLSYEWRVRDSVEKTYFISGKSSDTIQMRPGQNIATLVLRTSTPCVNAYADTIFIDPYVQVTLPEDTFLCAGSSIALNAETKLGTPDYNYNWNFGDTAKAINVELTSDTSLYVSVTDAEGCTHADTIHMKYKPLPKVSLDTGARICYNSQLELDPGNDTFPSHYRYLWNTNDTSRKITVNDSNTYTVRVKDSEGCMSYDTFKLYVNTVPINAGSNTEVCYADTVFLKGTGADSYRWYKLPGTSVVSSFSSMFEILTAPADYRLWGSRTYNGLTCENEDTISVAINQLPTINFAAIKPRCENDAPFNLSEGLSFPTLTSGTWKCIDDPDWVQNNTFFPDSVPVPASTGQKTIGVIYEVADNKGCVKTANTTFIVVRLPEVVLKDTSICGDKGKVTLLDLTKAPTTSAPGTWKWTSSNGSSGLEGSGKPALFDLSLVPQTFTYNICLELTNLFGCVNSNCLNLTSRPVPIVFAGNDIDKCGNDTIFKLNSVPTGGLWQTATGGLVGADFFNPRLVLSGQNHSLTYTYDIPGNNCPVTDTLLINVRPIPGLSINNPGSFCSDTGVIQLMSLVNPKGGSWSGIGTSPSGAFNTPEYLGLNDVRYDYTDAAGCRNFITASFNVQVRPAIDIILPDAVCVGVPIDLEAATENSSGISWTAEGDGNFTAPASLQTQYRPGPTDGEIVFVTGTAAGIGVCKAISERVQLNIFPVPSSVITVDTSQGCEPLTVSFQGTTDLPDNAGYLWNFDDVQSGSNTATTPNVSHTFNQNGSYSVTLKVTSKDNCSNTSNPHLITVHPMPQAAIDADNWITTIVQNTVQFYDRTTIDNPGIITSYLWNLGDPDSTISTDRNPRFEYPKDSADYYITLEVVSDKGCAARVGRELVILPELTVFIPNAFVPDFAGPADNNRFYVTANDFTNFRLEVFTRWGEKVYESININEGWDGKFKGESVQQDVYFYLVTITSIYGKTHYFKGTVTLLR